MRVELALPFIFGLIYGSFLNVVVFRFDEWLTILKGRSHCPQCKETLRWYDLIPVISYLTLFGRCRYCKKPISLQYPLVELSTAVLLAAGYSLVINAGLPLLTAVGAYLLYVLAVGALVVIFCHDLTEMMIPDSVAYFFVATAFGFGSLFTQNITATSLGGLVAVIPIALLVYPSRGKWMGEGDVKLSLGLGLLTGYPSAIVGLVTAFMSGAVIGLLMTAMRRGTTVKTAIPFAPFLIIGGLVALFYGDTLVHWYQGMLGY